LYFAYYTCAAIILGFFDQGIKFCGRDQNERLLADHCVRVELSTERPLSVSNPNRLHRRRRTALLGAYGDRPLYRTSDRQASRGRKRIAPPSPTTRPPAFGKAPAWQARLRQDSAVESRRIPGTMHYVYALFNDFWMFWASSSFVEAISSKQIPTGFREAQVLLRGDMF